MYKSINGLLLCLILSLCFQKASQAQTFRIGNVQTLKATAFDQKTKNIFAIHKDSIRVFYPPDYRKTRLIPIVPPDSYFPRPFIAICSDSALHFVNRSGGMVYRLENDSIKRIDRSFNHKMQINSNIFARNDTLMIFGGYGFWSDRNFFTYFSNETKEWEIIPPSGSSRLPPGGQNTFLTQNEKQTYIFSGSTTNEFNPLQVDDFKEVWRFDWNVRSWEHLGDQDLDFHNYSEVLHLGDKMLFGLPDKAQYVLVDPGDNHLTYYHISGKRKNNYPKNSQLNDIRSFYDEGKAYLVKFRSSQTEQWDGELVYSIIPIEDLLADPLYVENMYTTDAFPLKYAGGAAGILGVFLISLYARKRYLEKDKIVVSEKSVSFRRRKFAIDPTSLNVLNLLLRSKNDIQSQDIIDLVENPGQSSAHNIRIKNQVIENLNFQIKTLLGRDEDIIKSKPFKDDKRIKSYQINSDYFVVR